MDRSRFRHPNLVMYLGLMGLVFICLLLFARLREIESSITDLARTMAIEMAHEPTKIGNGQAALASGMGKEERDSR